MSTIAGRCHRTTEKAVHIQHRTQFKERMKRAPSIDPARTAALTIDMQRESEVAVSLVGPTDFHIAAKKGLDGFAHMDLDFLCDGSSVPEPS